MMAVGGVMCNAPTAKRGFSSAASQRRPAHQGSAQPPLLAQQHFAVALEPAPHPVDLAPLLARDLADALLFCALEFSDHEDPARRTSTALFRSGTLHTYATLPNATLIQCSATKKGRRSLGLGSIDRTHCRSSLTIATTLFERSEASSEPIEPTRCYEQESSAFYLPAGCVARSQMILNHWQHTAPSMAITIPSFSWSNNAMLNASRNIPTPKTLATRMTFKKVACSFFMDAKAANKNMPP